MKSLTTLSFSLPLLLLAACAGSTAPDPVDAKVSALRTSDPAASVTGTWQFDLDASEVAGPIRRQCAETSNGDATKQAACWDAIHAQAKREMIRLSGASPAVWTSFEREGDREVVFVEVPVELVSDGPAHVLAKVAGEARGPQAARFAASHVTAMRIEVVSPTTIAMTDPKKGRLVFSAQP